MTKSLIRSTVFTAVALGMALPAIAAIDAHQHNRKVNLVTTDYDLVDTSYIDRGRMDGIRVGDVFDVSMRSGKQVTKVVVTAVYDRMSAVKIKDSWLLKDGLQATPKQRPMVQPIDTQERRPAPEIAVKTNKAKPAQVAQAPAEAPAAPMQAPMDAPSLPPAEPAADLGLPDAPGGDLGLPDAPGGDDFGLPGDPMAGGDDFGLPAAPGGDDFGLPAAPGGDDFGLPADPMAGGDDFGLPPAPGGGDDFGLPPAPGGADDFGLPPAPGGADDFGLPPAPGGDLDVPPPPDF